MRKCLICLAALVWVCSPLPCEAAAAAKRLSFQGKASAQITRKVSVPFAMLVQEVPVSVGTVVKKDEPLLRYDLQPQDARSYQTLLSAKDGALLGTRQQLAAYGQDSQTARNNWQRDRALASQGFASQAEVKRSASALETLAARKTQLQAQLRANEKEYDLLLTELNSYFGSRLKRGDSLPDRFFLPSPMDGTVIRLAGSARPGGFVRPNEAAVTIACLDPIQAELQVHESEISKIHDGDTVSVEVPSLGGRRFVGEIVSMSWAADDMAVAMPSFYIITIDIKNPDNAIRPGYKVTAHIDLQ